MLTDFGPETLEKQGDRRNVAILNNLRPHDLREDFELRRLLAIGTNVFFAKDLAHHRLDALLFRSPFRVSRLPWFPRLQILDPSSTHKNPIARSLFSNETRKDRSITPMLYGYASP